MVLIAGSVVRQYRAEDFPSGKAVDWAEPLRLPNSLSFLTRSNIAPSLIAKAASLAHQEGVLPDEALLAHGLMEERTFYQLLARYLAVPFAGEPLPLDIGAAYAEAHEAGLAKIAHPDGVAFLSAPRGERLAAMLRMKERSGRAPRHLAITTPGLFARSLRHSVSKRLAADASFKLMSADANLSAKSGTSFSQKLYILVYVILAAIALYWAPAAALLAFSVLSALMFFSAAVYRLFVAASAMGTARKTDQPLADRDLPRYTIVVALHKEARICQALAERLQAIDYPRSKLDIKFVIEEDDDETRRALEALHLPPLFEIIVAPPGQPRTKPRALNIALPFARGDYLCVFDAEDAPDADQLRLAAARFAAAEETLACLQARLVVDNVADNALTKLFAIEYAALFEVQNAGLADCGHPLPLGGSSNHFRLPALRHVMGWDAWNVTEDADLGVRLARFGYQTGVLNSVTREEAPITLAAWLKQRRRWCKGWLQTVIAITRQPLRLARELGPRRAAAVALLLTGLVLGPLFWIPSVALMLWQFFAEGTFLKSDPGGVCLSALWTCVAALGVAALFFPAWLGMRRQNLMHLWPMLPCLFTYSALHSLAAWLAVYDLVRNPFHWHKTEHGLAKTSAAPRHAGKPLPDHPLPDHPLPSRPLPSRPLPDYPSLRRLAALGARP